MGKELRNLFQDLFNPRHAKKIRKEIDHILKIAMQIGGSLEEEAKQLHRDVLEFLKSPKDLRLIEVMKKHAMRLKHETEEL